jgi:hypothetical protein
LWQRLRFLRESGCDGAFQFLGRGIAGFQLQGPVGILSGRIYLILPQVEPC